MVHGQISCPLQQSENRFEPQPKYDVTDTHIIESLE